ncbi:nuclear transport factor 2 family protein [Thalassotalea sp. ND16A]|uniref:nuclear transport factor 2 family protein n=1 Tax=Thalassotalea sp. ND16A TaxID=1535422 RepID=UPI00051A0850|nr:nuclear transport factor 2 family protein [Thalassotalea sp. ND16A]KGK00400.1 hypothetical protein ND16A_3607 [Thalassotalea sp. ND16A]
MKNFLKLAVFIFCSSSPAYANEQALAELDAYWAEAERAVLEGDFAAYKASYHEDAILVSGFKNVSYPIANALARWQQGFDDTKDGKITASVEFRFSKRFHDQTTAHETGLFFYSTTDENGNKSDFIAHMDALLVKKSGKWVMMMEFQKSQASQAQWDALM